MRERRKSGEAQEDRGEELGATGVWHEQLNMNRLDGRCGVAANSVELHLRNCG